MGYLDTKDKKRGMAGSLVIHLLLLVLFAIYGLTYPDPLPEVGIPIQFGDSYTGSGDVEPEVTGTPPPQPNEPQPQESSPDEPVLTQDDIQTIETPPVEDEVKPDPDKPKETEPEKPVEQPKEPEEKPRELDPSLNNLLTNAFEKPGSSQGPDDNKGGNFGRPDGGPEGGVHGTPGAGGSGGGNYRLGNRNALAKIKPTYECEEYGVVIIIVRVNKQGKTIDAELQLKGTTNTAECLVARAKEAALKTKWEADASAPNIQIGSITYHFELN